MARGMSILSTELADEIAKAIRNGAGLDEASRQQDISRTTTTNWQRRGREVLAQREAWAHGELDEDPEESEHDELCAYFAEAIAKARADWKVEAIVEIYHQGRGAPWEEVHETVERDEHGNEVVTKRITKKGTARDWRALQAMLGARYPAEWRSQKVIVAGNEDGGPIQVEHDYVTPLAMLGDVFAALKEAGQLDRVLAELPAGSNGQVVDTEAHELHPGSPNGETDGVPPSR